MAVATNINTLPVTITGESQFCEGSSAILKATAGFKTYTWNTGDLTDSTTVYQTGVYSVVVTDGSGNTGVDYFSVTTLDNVSFRINGPVTMCSTDEETLSLTETFDNYLWEDGTNQATRLISNCQIYSVTVTNQYGCTQVETIDVACPSSIDISLGENNGVSCYGECDGVLQAGLAHQNTGSTMVWSTGSSNSRIENLCPGDYSITVTDPNGCTANETFTVSEPDTLGLVIDTIVPVICYDDIENKVAVHATGGTSPYLYFWPDGTRSDTIKNISSGIHSVTVVDQHSCDAIFDIIIEEITPIFISVDDVTHVECNGENTGEIIVNATGGYGEYIYQWNTGEQSDTITNLESDVYAVTVFDAMGCATTKIIAVEENPILSATFKIDPISQNGANDGSITINPEGGTGLYQFKWNTEDNTPSIYSLSPGEYRCTITDSEDCVYIAETTLLEGDCLLNLTATSTDALCLGSFDGSIQMETQYGILPIETYVINSEGNRQDNTNLPAGEYTVITQDDSGCSDQAILTIGEPTAIHANIELLHAPTCDNMPDGTAMIHVEGGEQPYSFRWSNGKTSQMANELTNGMQSVEIIDANGCFISIALMVQSEDIISPILEVNPIEIEIDANGQLDMPVPESFVTQFSDNCSAVVLNFKENLEADCINSVQDVVIIASDTNGNTTEKATTLTIKDLIAPTINCPANILIGECEDLIYSVSATDNCQGEVTIKIDGYAPEDVIPIGESTVTIEAIDINENKSICSFLVSKVATPDILLDKLDITCAGHNDGEVTILNSEEFSTIEINSNLGSFDNLDQGSYTIIVTDIQGCVQSTDVTILTPSPISITNSEVNDITGPDLFDGTISLNISGGTAPYKIVWYHNENLTELSGENISNLDSGSYHCVIADANNCQLESEVFMIGVISSLSDIDETNNPVMMIYPNPALDIISIDIINLANHLNVKEVNIYDISGKRQYHGNQDSSKTISIQSWKSGLYIVEVHTLKGKFTERMIKL